MIYFASRSRYTFNLQWNLNATWQFSLASLAIQRSTHFPSFQRVISEDSEMLVTFTCEGTINCISELKRSQKYICVEFRVFVLRIHFNFLARNGHFRNVISSWLIFTAHDQMLSLLYRDVDHSYCHDLGVTVDGVRICEWIYWPLIRMTRNYKQFQRHR
jgi:hypothetical protein